MGSRRPAKEPAPVPVQATAAPVPVATPPKGPRARLARQEAVERHLLAGKSIARCCADLPSQFGVSAWTIRSDARRTLRRWAKEDRWSLSKRRSAVLRRLERVAIRAEDEGALDVAVSANREIARCLGMHENRIEVSVAGEIDHLHHRTVMDPAAYLQAFLRAVREIGLDAEALAVRVDDTRGLTRGEPTGAVQPALPPEGAAPIALPPPAPSRSNGKVHPIDPPLTAGLAGQHPNAQRAGDSDAHS